MDRKRKQNLTLRYGGIQCFYWAFECPLVAYGALYLQEKGFSPSVVGICMALGSVLPALLLPVLASAADRTRRFSLRQFLVVILGSLLAVVLCIPVLRLKGRILFAVYLLVLIIVHLPESFLSGIADYCFRHGIYLNFSASRGAGSLSFGVSSCLIGYAFRLWDADSALWIAAVCIAGCILLLFTLPVMPPDQRMSSENAARHRQPGGGRGHTAGFIRRYPRYTQLMCGFFFLAVLHVMEESFLINIMKRIGGDSSSVGIVLFLCNAVEFIIIFFYERFRPLMKADTWMKTAAMLFLIKAVLIHFAPSVPVMYAVQIIAAAAYGLYAPALVHFANAETSPEDAVMGQSLFNAVFTLGGSLGNFLGGLLLGYFNVRVMTLAGIICALSGTAICLFRPRSRNRA